MISWRTMCWVVACISAAAWWWAQRVNDKDALSPQNAEAPVITLYDSDIYRYDEGGMRNNHLSAEKIEYFRAGRDTQFTKPVLRHEVKDGYILIDADRGLLNREQDILLSGGVGRALCEYLDKAGHDLLLSDLDPLALEALDDTLQHDSHTLVPFDLWRAGADEYSRLAALIHEDHGHLHALIHCAAYCGNLRPMVQIDPESWLKALQTNLTAPLWLTQALLPLLRKENGRIIFTRFPDHKRQSAYWHGFGVSQQALDALIRALADEGSAYPEIGFATVSPPWVDTRLSRSIFPDGQADWRYPEEIVSLYDKALSAPLTDKPQDFR